MKLKEYYRKVVGINDSLEGGWAKSYYGIFSKLINENNYKVIAEVGIGYGTHAKYVMKTTDVDKMYLIDPMTYYENDSFAEDVMAQEADISGNNFNELYSLIQSELKPWNHRIVFLQVPSLDVTDEMIPDESLDCLFLDGDHSFGAVLMDLQFWWPKIRKGGMLVGDDWWMPDVNLAVIKFAHMYDLKINFHKKDEEQYFIYSFKKE